MFIHLRYGSEKEEYVMEFDHNFVTVIEVLIKVKKRYGRYCRLQLFNEYKQPLERNDVVEKARSYQIKRQPR